METEQIEKNMSFFSTRQLGMELKSKIMSRTQSKNKIEQYHQEKHLCHLKI